MAPGKRSTNTVSRLGQLKRQKLPDRNCCGDVEDGIAAAQPKDTSETNTTVNANGQDKDDAEDPKVAAKLENILFQFKKITNKEPSKEQILQICENKEWREKRKAQARNVLDKVVKRTELKELGQDDSFIQLRQSVIEKIALAFGVDASSFFFYKIELKDEYDTSSMEESVLRGGFSKEEGSVMNKVPVGKRTLYRNKKTCARILTRCNIPENKVGAMLLFDGKGDLVVIMMLNVFNKTHLVSRSFFVDQYREHLLHSMGGALSGLVNLEKTLPTFQEDKEVRSNYFGGLACEYDVLGIFPGSRTAKKGELHCAKMRYSNRKGQTKEFQCGNPIARYIASRDRKKDKIGGILLPESQTFEQRQLHVLKKLSSLIYMTKGPGKEKIHSRDLSKTRDLAFHHAINRYDEGSHYNAAIHQDATAHAATIISCFAEGSLQSKFQCNADAGQLFVEFGGCTLPFGEKDAIIFCGNTHHGPLPPSAAKEHKGGPVRRFSIATYLSSA